MIANRLRFRPKLSDSLETREVMSHYLPLPAAVAILHGQQMHPIMELTKENATRSKSYAQGVTPAKFAFNVKLDRAAIPGATAAEKANPYLNTYLVSYDNGRNTSYAWAAISETLEPGMKYVPGSVVQPPGSTFTVTSNANGGETLTLIIPAGIPTGAQGYLAFETKYHTPPSPSD